MLARGGGARALQMRGCVGAGRHTGNKGDHGGLSGAWGLRDAWEGATVLKGWHARGKRGHSGRRMRGKRGNVAAKGRWRDMVRGRVGGRGRMNTWLIRRANQHPLMSVCSHNTQLLM